MKRLINAVLLVTAAVYAASCQKEQLEPSYQNGDGNTCITLEIGGKPQTKAVGDVPAVDVYYEIYEDNTCARRLFPATGDNFPSDNMPNVVALSEDGNAYINVKLLKDKEYWFVFWAMEKGAPYTWNSLNAISMNWTDKGNADNRDAFFGSVYVKGGKTATVTLVRPFAQLNFGAEPDEMAEDLNGVPCAVTTWAENYKSYYPFQSSKVTVTGALADTFNASDATASASASMSELTFNADALYGTLAAEDHLKISDEKSYIHVAMNYILPASDSENGNKAVVDVNAEFVIKDGEQDITIRHDITNVPLEDNKRTNLIGSLFTTDGEIIVNLSDWNEEDNNVELWDGSAEEVTPEDDGFVITTPAQLTWVAQQVNSGADDFAGKTVRLGADINLAGIKWTPIGLNADDAAKRFKGTFDGNGFVLSNLYVDTEPGYTAAGLFGALNGTVQNLVIENATVKHICTGSASDNGIAVVAGSVYTTGNIQNVTVRNATVEGNHYLGGISGYTYGNIKDCTVEQIVLKAVPNVSGTSYDNGDKVGGIAGYFTSDGGKFEISGNTVDGFEIYAYRDAGGIIGCGHGITGKVMNNKALNGTVTADQNVNFYESKELNASDIVGRITSGDLDASNSSENVEVIEKPNVVAEINAKLSSGENITLEEDVESAPIVTAPYGNKAGIVQRAGTVIDGGGNTVSINSNGDDVYGIMTAGGTIKNISVDAYRSCMIMNPTADIRLEGFIADGSQSGSDIVYTLNTGEITEEVNLYATDCTFNGWTSFASLASATFTNCHFGQGRAGVGGRLVKPYITTVFEGCDFSDGYYLDLSMFGLDTEGITVISEEYTVEFRNCTINGNPLTKDLFDNVEEHDYNTVEQGRLMYEVHDKFDVWKQVSFINE